MRAVVRERTLRLRSPMRSAHGDMTERPLLLLEVEDADGRTAAGEAAPLESYDGVSVERCRAALDIHAQVLNAASASTGAQLLDACREADPLPQALSAVDIALWSLAGLREGKSVSALLSDAALAQIAVNGTIGADDPAAAAAQARRLADSGLRCLKLKVGVGDDAARLAEVRQAIGDDVLLRLDANGAWTVDEALSALADFPGSGIELVEEPVHGVDALREVQQRSGMRIAMDETGAELGAIASGATDAVCLKLSRAGGISALLAQAALARLVGSQVYISSTFDGPIGIAA
ncbi:MAG: hypothetical protein F2796_04340, partial [Actinobacteria bacterium]|nr:hypothetical protein [Actinomycetota bacterium]